MLIYVCVYKNSYLFTYDCNLCDQKPFHDLISPEISKQLVYVC